MKAIGIVANPASGQDIRRLVAYGTCFSNSDKMDIIRRVVMGASVTGVQAIYYLCDHRQLFTRALEGISAPHAHFIRDMRFIPADNPVSGREIDSTIATENMVKAGVKCIITLGGDGTNRAVSIRSGDVPLIPLSTGTNNVFPKQMDGTVAGEAAGIFAAGCLQQQKYFRPTKRLDVYVDGVLTDVALIDVAVLRSRDLASRALWRAEQIKRVFLTSASSVGIGISNLGVYEREVSEQEPHGVYIETGDGGERFWVPFAPGLMEQIGIRSHRTIDMHEEISFRPDRACVAAVDGERNVTFPAGCEVSVRLTWNGPKVLDVSKVLSAAIKAGAFHVKNRA